MPTISIFALVLAGWAVLASTSRTGFLPQPYRCEKSGSCDGHDPSGLQSFNDSMGEYYASFVTASGRGEALGIRYIKVGEEQWRRGSDIYIKPSWVDELYPTKKMGCDGQQSCGFWAPDLPSNGNGVTLSANHFLVYYSLADFVDGDEGLWCVGALRGEWKLAGSVTVEDIGTPVLCTNSSMANQGAPHAIDPSVMVDDDGRWWLTLGSWNNYGTGAHQGARAGGVWMVELDPATGGLGRKAREHCGSDFPFCFDLDKAREPDKPGLASPYRNIANHRGYNTSTQGYLDGNSIEASYLYNNFARTGYYYLFVNWFFCCRGPQSTYQIMVGRSRSPTGPFVDRRGISMQEAGGELFLNSTDADGRTFVGPGHAGIHYDERRGTGRYALTVSYEAIAQKNMQLDAFEVEFGDDGWPYVVGMFSPP